MLSETADSDLKQLRCSIESKVLGDEAARLASVVGAAKARAESIRKRMEETGDAGLLTVLEDAVCGMRMSIADARRIRDEVNQEAWKVRKELEHFQIGIGLVDSRDEKERDIRDRLDAACARVGEASGVLDSTAARLKEDIVALERAIGDIKREMTIDLRRLAALDRIIAMGEAAAARRAEVGAEMELFSM